MTLAHNSIGRPLDSSRVCLQPAQDGTASAQVCQYER
jgi:hypothetical protein